MFSKLLSAVLLCLSASLALADATVPTADKAGSADPAGLGRYEGAFIVEQQAKAYDELVLPTAALTPDPDDEKRDGMNNRLMRSASQLALEGKLTRTVYVLPAGRSSLEVLRNYQQLIQDKGGQPLYECKAENCGGDVTSGATHGGGDQGLLNYLFPKSAVTEQSFSNAACAVDMNLADLRYGVAKFSANGVDTHVAVLAFTAKDDLYCKALNERTVAIVVTLEAKAREQKMITLKASEMAQAIANGGKVAIYGIYFDFDKADLKPESRPQLDEIAGLLKADGALRLVVAGHTDNQGGAAYNMDLSKKRADAVVAALSANYGIAADRLLAQGMGSAAPVASNDDEAGRAKNRRVELVKQ
jgi:outer membrane protein OmpA-like peptidoglycan-associated protein